MPRRSSARLQRRPHHEQKRQQPPQHQPSRPAAECGSGAGVGGTCRARRGPNRLSTSRNIGSAMAASTAATANAVGKPRASAEPAGHRRSRADARVKRREDRAKGGAAARLADVLHHVGGKHGIRRAEADREQARRDRQVHGRGRHRQHRQPHGHHDQARDEQAAIAELVAEPAQDRARHQRHQRQRRQVDRLRLDAERIGVDGAEAADGAVAVRVEKQRQREQQDAAFDPGAAWGAT